MDACAIKSDGCRKGACHSNLEQPWLVFSVVRALACTLKVAIRFQVKGMYLCGRLDPQSSWEVPNQCVCVSLTSMFLFFSFSLLPSLPLSLRISGKNIIQ